VLCLVRGEALIEGTPQEVQSDPRVIEAYIGTGEEDDDEDEDVVPQPRQDVVDGEETP
jgi:branched-chain amino acid transport system ATP-binding protein